MFEVARKMGKLLLQIQTKKGRTALTYVGNAGGVKTNSEVVSEIGFERNATNEFEQMAQKLQEAQEIEEVTGEDPPISSEYQ